MSYNTLSNGRVNHLKFEESTWKERLISSRGLTTMSGLPHKNHPDASRVPTIHIPGRSYSKVAKT